MRSVLAYTPLLLALLLQGCALNTAAPGVRTDRSRILQEEISGISARNGYEVVQMLRPEWLRRRPVAQTDGRGVPEVVVFLNDSRYGTLESLESISVDMIGAMEYLGGSEAQREFTSRSGRNVAAVIHVYSAHLAEQRAPAQAPPSTGAARGIALSVYPLGGLMSFREPDHVERFERAGWEQTDHASPEIGAFMAALHVGMTPAVGAEVFVASRPGVAEESYSRWSGSVHYRRRSAVAGALMTRELTPRVQAGAGVVLERAILDWAAGVCRCGQQGTREQISPGGVVDLLVQLPGGGRFFSALRVQGQMFASKQLVSYPHTPAMEMGGMKVLVGLGGGMRMRLPD